MATIGVVFWWETGISLIQIFTKICCHKRRGSNCDLQFKHASRCGVLGLLSIVAEMALF